MSALEETLALHLRAKNIKGWDREYRFAAHYVGLGPGIKARLKQANLKDWRIDFAWPSQRLAVEIEGGIHVQGRHSRGAGFREDCLKYDAMMRLGWTVYRCEESMVKSGRALDTIIILLVQRAG